MLSESPDRKSVWITPPHEIEAVMENRLPRGVRPFVPVFFLRFSRSSEFLVGRGDNGDLLFDHTR